MTVEDPTLGVVLLCIAGGRACAVPLSHVVETMRPLPLSPVAALPGCVLGSSIIRGESAPVVELAALLGVAAASHAPVARYITLRTQPRCIALAVEQVLGVRDVDAQTLRALPSLSSPHSRALTAQIEPWGAALAAVLDASRAWPPEHLTQQADAR